MTSPATSLRPNCGPPLWTIPNSHSAPASMATRRLPATRQAGKPAGKNEVTLPEHLKKALPQVIAGDDIATTVFLAEALKPKDTGKQTSTRDMTRTGVWSERDTREASAENGRQDAEAFID